MQCQKTEQHLKIVFVHFYDFFSDLLETDIKAYHFNDTLFDSLETSPLKDYQHMHQKAVENDWVFDLSEALKHVQIYMTGTAAYFLPDVQFYYFFALKIKRGDDQNMMRTRVQIQPK